MESALGLRVVNGIVWVMPVWMRFPEFVTVLVSPVTVLALAGYEVSVRGLVLWR